MIDPIVSPPVPRNRSSRLLLSCPKCGEDQVSLISRKYKDETRFTVETAYYFGEIEKQSLSNFHEFFEPFQADLFDEKTLEKLNSSGYWAYRQKKQALKCYCKTCNFTFYTKCKDDET